MSPRLLASWVTDNMGFSVSESAVYRILRWEGLVKKPEIRLAAGRERGLERLNSGAKLPLPAMADGVPEGLTELVVRAMTQG